MPAKMLPLIAYVLISTFTPGPSNISSASLGILRGYRNTLNYQGGLAAGVFLLMFLSGWISTTVLNLFPTIEPILRYAGAGYILYLAYGILKASYWFEDQKEQPFGFTHGVTLQILNPKLIVYAFTLYSTFLSHISRNVVLWVVSAILLAAISFCATSVWALFGTAIKARLHNYRFKMVVNILLSLTLVYTAITLIVQG